MTPAEFKTIRERLGLTAQAFGLLLERAVRDRTVRYWEAGAQPIPDDARDFLLMLDALAEQQARHALTVVADVTATQGGAPDSVTLLRYADDADIDPPLRRFGGGFHSAMTGRVREALERTGVRVRIVYYDKPACSAWLRANGLRNDPAGRSAWAADQAGLN